MQAAAAQFIIALHLLVVLFNLFGLIAIPLGGWRGWRFVRLFWWRTLHLALMGGVAVQALAGRACILTIWEHALEGEATSPAPMIQQWMESLLYWDFPLWTFAAAYTALFIYCLALWRLVPPMRRARRP
ncbi:MAG: DUF2784 domain-containing protein [Rhodospirillaceae bacterium]